MKVWIRENVLEMVVFRATFALLKNFTLAAAVKIW